jgi:CubicO group peptidase (beta-lactamase class C family)
LKARGREPSSSPFRNGYVDTHIAITSIPKSLSILLGLVIAQSGTPSNLQEQVAAIVQKEMLAQGVPSASVAIMRDGKMVLQQAWGVADIDKKKPADASTTYPIASVSKQFTAALVLKQVDRGRVSLSDPIGKHLPGLRNEYATLPIEQILNHTSGLPNDYRNPERRLETHSVEQMLAMVNATTPVNPPGTKYVYSNTGYFLLTVLAEKLYGKPYATVLQDEIATPLGLGLALCVEPKPGEAAGYRRMPDGKIVPPPTDPGLTCDRLWKSQAESVAPFRDLGRGSHISTWNTAPEWPMSTSGFFLLAALVDRLCANPRSHLSWRVRVPTLSGPTGNA